MQSMNITFSSSGHIIRSTGVYTYSGRSRFRCRKYCWTGLLLLCVWITTAFPTSTFICCAKTWSEIILILLNFLPVYFVHPCVPTQTSSTCFHHSSSTLSLYFTAIEFGHSLRCRHRTFNMAECVGDLCIGLLSLEGRDVSDTFSTPDTHLSSLEFSTVKRKLFLQVHKVRRHHKSIRQNCENCLTLAWNDHQTMWQEKNYYENKKNVCGVMAYYWMLLECNEK